MITTEQAKNLKHGEIIYSVLRKNADGSPQRWRVNGKVKTWKHTPLCFIVPLKRGLYEHDYLTEWNNTEFALIEKEAK